MTQKKKAIYYLNYTKHIKLVVRFAQKLTRNAYNAKKTRWRCNLFCFRFFSPFKYILLKHECTDAFKKRKTRLLLNMYSFKWAERLLSIFVIFIFDTAYQLQKKVCYWTLAHRCIMHTAEFVLHSFAYDGTNGIHMHKLPNDDNKLRWVDEHTKIFLWIVTANSANAPCCYY